jgi:hypothetical protein
VVEKRKTVMRIGTRNNAWSRVSTSSVRVSQLPTENTNNNNINMEDIVKRLDRMSR